MMTAPPDSDPSPAPTLPPPPTEAELAAARREYRLLKWLLIGALWTSAAVALSLNLADPDLWGHVKYGQDVLADGHLHATATYTYTAPEHRWINHENLAELTMATLYGWFGDSGLLVAKCLLGLAILGAMAHVASRHGVGPLTTAAFLLLVANNLTAFFPVRPQLLSFAWCTLMLLVLERAFAGWQAWLHREATATGEASDWSVGRLRWLLWLLPIVALWTNSHGAFVAGVMILLAYLTGRGVEVLLYRREDALPVITCLVASGALASAATLLNPYGWHLHHWLRMSLGRPRPEITEWAAPAMSDPVFWPLVALMGVAVASWTLTTRRRDWVQIAILALVAWQAWSHLRHIAFFALLCGFWLPVDVHSMLLRLRPDTRGLPVQRLGTWWRWSFAAALLVAVGLQSAMLHQRLSMLPVERSRYPVDALQWMADRQVHGKLVVAFNWAQYAIAALAPETTVAFDGRFRTCYPQQVVDMYFDFLIGPNEGKRYRRPDAGPIDPTAILEYQHPELVLVDRRYRHSVEVMQDEAAKADPQWTLLYQDGVAQLWGRASLYDNPRSLRYIAPAERHLTDHLAQTAVAWPALPERPPARVFAGHRAAPAEAPEF